MINKTSQNMMSSEGEAMRCVPSSVTIRNLWRDLPDSEIPRFCPPHCEAKGGTPGAELRGLDMVLSPAGGPQSLLTWVSGCLAGAFLPS